MCFTAVNILRVISECRISLAFLLTVHAQCKMSFASSIMYRGSISYLYSSFLDPSRRVLPLC